MKMLITNSRNSPSIGILLTGEPYALGGGNDFGARTAYGLPHYEMNTGLNGLNANYGYPETHLMQALPQREFEIVYLPVSRL